VSLWEDDVEEVLVLAPEPERGGSGPLHWPTLQEADLVDAQASLTVWVEELVDRFDLARAVPACWNLHNQHVEILQALRDHERGSYSPNADPGAAVDWLRAVRDLTDILTEATRRAGCSTAQHHPAPARTWSTDQWPAWAPPASATQPIRVVTV